jgi:hypothetical protein
MLMATISILADFHSTIGWVGTDSLVIILIYFGGVWLIQWETGP